MNQVKNKKLCFWHFFEFVTSALTLRPRNRYIYVFGTLFSFCNFLVTSSGFQKAGVCSFSSTLNFEETELDFCCLVLLVCCCAGNQYSELTGSFF